MIEICNSTDDVRFGVTTFPDRKRACLYVRSGNVITPVAYFTSDSRKNRFIDTLIKVLGSSLTKED